MKKGRMSRCPYCGRLVNYFYLYDCKRYDFGYCSHCGGIYAVRYSPAAYLLVLGVAAVFAGGFAFYYLANKSIPGYLYLLECVLALLAVYFVLPFFIAPQKCIVRGQLGGFPTPDQIPAYQPRFRRKPRHAESTDEPFSAADSLQPVQIPPDKPENPPESHTESNTGVKIYKKETKLAAETPAEANTPAQTGSAGNRFKP